MEIGWVQILVLFLANAGLVIWFRNESKNEWQYMDTKLEAMHREMKDFHGRLVALEERFYARMMTILSSKKDEK